MIVVGFTPEFFRRLKKLTPQLQELAFERIYLEIEPITAILKYTNSTANLKDSSVFQLITSIESCLSGFRAMRRDCTLSATIQFTTNPHGA